MGVSGESLVFNTEVVLGSVFAAVKGTDYLQAQHGGMRLAFVNNNEINRGSFMPFERSLLERIDHYHEESERRTERDEGKAMDSVLENLQKIFNTRRDTAAGAMDYGLPDFNDLIWEFPDVILEIKKAILDNIVKYEPRLNNVRIKHIKDEENPLDLKFQIAGQLQTGRGRKGVKFTTIMGESGRIRVWS